MRWYPLVLGQRLAALPAHCQALGHLLHTALSTETDSPEASCPIWHVMKTSASL